MTPEDLDLVPLNDLAHAMLRRADHGVIVLLRLDGAGPGWNEYIRKWRGNSHTIAGLALDAAHAVILNFKEGCVAAEGQAPDTPPADEPE